MKRTNNVKDKLRKLALLTRRGGKRLRHSAPGAFGKCHNSPPPTPRDLIPDKFLHSAARKRKNLIA